MLIVRKTAATNPWDYPQLDLIPTLTHADGWTVGGGQGPVGQDAAPLAGEAPQRFPGPQFNVYAP